MPHWRDRKWTCHAIWISQNKFMVCVFLTTRDVISFLPFNLDEFVVPNSICCAFLGLFSLLPFFLLSLMPTNIICISFDIIHCSGGRQSNLIKYTPPYALLPIDRYSMDRIKVRIPTNFTPFIHGYGWIFLHPSSLHETIIIMFLLSGKEMSLSFLLIWFLRNKRLWDVYL